MNWASAKRPLGTCFGLDYPHEVVRHSVGEYIKGMAHTNGIEPFWTLLKWGYQGVYHKMERPHLQRYVNEYAGRYNLRNQSTMFKVPPVVTGLIGKRLTYRQLTLRG